MKEPKSFLFIIGIIALSIYLLYLIGQYIPTINNGFIVIGLVSAASMLIIIILLLSLALFIYYIIDK